MGVLDYLDQDTYEAFKRQQRERRKRQQEVRVDPAWQAAVRGPIEVSMPPDALQDVSHPLREMPVPNVLQRAARQSNAEPPLTPALPPNWSQRNALPATPWELAVSLREPAADWTPPPPVEPTEGPIGKAAVGLLRGAGEANEGLRRNVPGYAGAADVTGQTAGALGSMFQRASQPQAEVLYGEMVRRPSFGLSERGLPPVAESALSGLGTLALESARTSIPEALQRAGRRWNETEMPESLRLAGELSTPTELALNLAPVPVEKLGGTAVRGVRATGRLAARPEVQRAASRLGGIVPRLGIEDVTKGLIGKVTKATGTDPNRAYEFRYRLADLDQLVPSHTDRLGVNPQFPAELQPRLRDRAASELQIDKMAKELNPDALLADVGTLDRGSMIVGPDSVVESGNGRVLALRRARALYPERFADYEAKLTERLPRLGINPEDAQALRHPVLVRERVSEVDRAAFTAEANQPAVLAMSPFEVARQDAKRISDELLTQLEITESQSVDQALKAAANRHVVQAFVRAVPETEQAALVDATGGLNQLGLQRLKSGLFAKVYQGEVGQRLAQAVTESIDPTVKQIENGLFASLPRMARAEALIRGGVRDAGLSITEDVSRAVDILGRLRQNGMRVDDYLRQSAMFEAELSPLQQRLLAFFTAIGRSPRKVREFLGQYADAVENAPAVGQEALFELEPITKEATIERLIRQEAAREAERVGPLFRAGDAAEVAEGATTAPIGQELERGVLDTAPEQVTPLPSPAGPLGQPPATPIPHAQPTGVQPPTQTRPARMLPEVERPRRTPPNMYEVTPPQREQGALEGFEGAATVPPRTSQARLPGEAGRMPPRIPPSGPAPEPRVTPEPPPPDGILPRFPANEVLEARTEPKNLLIKAEHALAKVPGVKGVVRVVDPWAAQQSHLERIPLVFRQMEAMGSDIVRNAMAYLEATPLRGVKIKNGRFVDGVKPRRPGLSMATSDVLEHIGDYEVAPALLEFVRTANRLNDDLVRWARSEGIKLPLMHYEPGGHYFGRLVKEIRDVEKRGRLRPDMPRHYDSMEAGMDAGVVYSDDLLATAQAGYSWLIRKITSARMAEYARELGRTPKQMIDPELTGRAVEATQNLRIVRNYDRTLKAMRDGMAPTFQVKNGERVRAQLTAIDKVEPGVSKQVIETWERVKDLPAGDPIRRAAFKELLTDAQKIGKKALGEYRTTTSERARALKSLQSPEYAEGERFGLPKGTVGVGAVRQAWAAGRAFPRETADFLNKTFGETAHKILRATDTVSSTSRSVVAGFDLGTTQIQLLGIMFSRPKVWASAFSRMFTAVAQPQTYHAYMARPETLAVLKKLIPHGLTIEGAEYAEAMQRGGALQRLAGRLGTRVGGAVDRQFLKRAEMAFTAPLNVGKIEMARALLPSAERQGRLDDLAMFLNNITGTRSLTAAGIGPGQRSIEGSFVFFSPRFTHASLAIIADALQGGLRGSEARRALASLMVGSTLVTGGLRKALGQEVTPGFFDPSNPEFQSAELFSRRMGFGGPYRAIAVLLGSSYKAARQEPGLFLDLKNRMENPVVRWWTSRSAPVTGLIWDSLAGRDFLGEPLDSPEAWARRIGKMAVPFPAQEFAIREPGQKPPEEASLIPEVLGLRAVPLSPAMERDRLRDQLARKAYGSAWEQIDRAKQVELEQQHPELVAAAKGAIETYARRGSLLHEFRADVDQLRQEPSRQVAALTEQLRAGRISGYDYRKAVQEREAEMARIPAQLQKTTKYQGIPLKEEEWKAWAERTGQPMAERTSPVDQFLDAHYAIADQKRDPNTGEVNAAELVRAREALKGQYPAEVVAEATAYLNRNRAPELVEAQGQYAEYMQIPKYVGFSQEQQDTADKIARFVTAYSKELGGSEQARALALRTFGASKYGLWLASRTKDFQNPQRGIYRRNHPLIDEFYGRGSTAEFKNLVPAGSR